MQFDPETADTLVELLSGSNRSYLHVNDRMIQPGQRVKLPAKLAKEYSHRGEHGEPPMVKIIDDD